jgi:hypothetical protein
MGRCIRFRQICGKPSNLTPPRNAFGPISRHSRETSGSVGSHRLRKKRREDAASRSASTNCAEACEDRAVGRDVHTAENCSPSIRNYDDARLQLQRTLRRRHCRRHAPLNAVVRRSIHRKWKGGPVEKSLQSSLMLVALLRGSPIAGAQQVNNPVSTKLGEDSDSAWVVCL